MSNKINHRRASTGRVPSRKDRFQNVKRRNEDDNHSRHVRNRIMSEEHDTDPTAIDDSECFE